MEKRLLGLPLFKNWRISLILCSAFVVGFGQPNHGVLASVFSSICGFSLFWWGIALLHSRKTTFLIGLIWFFSVQLIQFSWLTSTEYQGLYIYGVYLVLALLFGLQFGSLSLLIPKNRSLVWYEILGISGIWILFEWSRLFIFCGCAWNFIGLSQTAVSWGGQIAAVFGVLGLSYWVMMTNLVVYSTIISWRKTRFNQLIFFSMICIFAPYILGGFYIACGKKIGMYDEKNFHVGLVHTGLLPDEKEQFLGKEEKWIPPLHQWDWLLSEIAPFVSPSLPPLDLLILPEYAVPFFLDDPVYPKHLIDRVVTPHFPLVNFVANSSKRSLSNRALGHFLAQALHAEVILGCDREEDGQMYNSAVCFDPDSNDIQLYDKKILLPLAEYLPMHALQSLAARYGVGGFFSHGNRSNVLEGKKKLALSICYEDCFSFIMREGRKQGGEVLINLTNDGWYPNTKLPVQHFQHARIRAIENGAFLLRCCNIGVTSVIDPFGRVVDWFPKPGSKNDSALDKKRGILSVSFLPFTITTLYTLWGDFPLLFFSILMAVMFFLRKTLRHPLQSLYNSENIKV